MSGVLEKKIKIGGEKNECFRRIKKNPSVQKRVEKKNQDEKREFLCYNSERWEDISSNENFVGFHEISKEIKILAEKISVLREKIMNTNIQTIVTIEDNDITLAKLKLLIDDIRSELAQLDGINERDIFGSRRRRIATTEEEEKEIAQLTDMQLETLILQLEEMCNKPSYLNWWSLIC